jgi:hypothetical protein
VATGVIKRKPSPWKAPCKASHAKMVEVPGFEPCFPREAKSLENADLVLG